MKQTAKDLNAKRNIPFASEFEEQCALVAWKEANLYRYPELVMLYHVPNGELRDKKTAGKLKKMGVVPGIWDFSLDVPAGRCHGAKIELKVASTPLSEDQRKFHKLYESYGYKAIIGRTWEQAACDILGYLGYKWT